MNVPTSQMPVTTQQHDNGSAQVVGVGAGSHKKMIIAVVIIFILAVAAAAYFFLPQLSTQENDAPPSLEVVGGAQGSFIDKKFGFLNFDTNDISGFNSFAAQQMLLNPVAGKLKSGINFVTVTSAQTWADLVKGTNPAVKKALYVSYNNEKKKFETYPSGPYAGTITLSPQDIAVKKLSSGDGLIIVAEQPGDIYGVRVSDQKASTPPQPFGPDAAGWYIVSANSTNLADAMADIKDRVEFAYAKLNSSAKFQLVTAPYAFPLSDFYSFWVKIKKQVTPPPQQQQSQQQSAKQSPPSQPTVTGLSPDSYEIVVPESGLPDLSMISVKASGSGMQNVTDVSTTTNGVTIDPNVKIAIDSQTDSEINLQVSIAPETEPGSKFIKFTLADGKSMGWFFKIIKKPTASNTTIKPVSISPSQFVIGGATNFEILGSDFNLVESLKANTSIPAEDGRVTVDIKYQSPEKITGILTASGFNNPISPGKGSLKFFTFGTTDSIAALDVTFVNPDVIVDSPVSISIPQGSDFSVDITGKKLSHVGEIAIQKYGGGGAMQSSGKIVQQTDNKTTFTGSISALYEPSPTSSIILRLRYLKDGVYGFYIGIPIIITDPKPVISAVSGAFGLGTQAEITITGKNFGDDIDTVFLRRGTYDSAAGIWSATIMNIMASKVEKIDASTIKATITIPPSISVGSASLQVQNKKSILSGHKEVQIVPVVDASIAGPFTQGVGSSFSVKLNVTGFEYIQDIALFDISGVVKVSEQTSYTLGADNIVTFTGIDSGTSGSRYIGVKYSKDGVIDYHIKLQISSFY